MCESEKYIYVSDEEVDKVLDDGLERFQKLIGKYRFKPWPIILLFLLISFSPLGIVFLPTEYRIIRKKFKIEDGWSGDTTTSKDSLITLSITIDEMRKLRNLNYIKTFRNRIYKPLVHELVHERQFGEMDEGFLARLADKGIGGDDAFGYYSNKYEIEAFSREAAKELKDGFSDVVDNYINCVKYVSDGSWRRFLKKTYQYLDVYKYNMSKKNLRMQLSDRNTIEYDILELEKEVERLQKLIRDKEKS